MFLRLHSFGSSALKANTDNFAIRAVKKRTSDDVLNIKQGNILLKESGEIQKQVQNKRRG